MPITKFSFFDKARDWRLNEVSFDQFNLLVGISGVGKTQILKALQKTINAGITESVDIEGCQWSVEIIEDGKVYVWSAETDVVYPPSSEEEADNWSSDRGVELVQETITQGNEVLVERSWGAFNFKATELPKFKQTESAISLLRQEEAIAPLYRALMRIIFSEGAGWGFLAQNIQTNFGLLLFDNDKIEQIRKRYATLNSLREARGVPLLTKAYVLQKDYPEEFEKLKEAYKEIFPSVLDVKLDDHMVFLGGTDVEASPFDMQWWLSVCIRERGVQEWIMNNQISSGMLRTLIHLFELALSSTGTVIVIDEVENSLGINCLSPIVEQFLAHNDIQFILTSHHPYIINEVPMHYWKLVTRTGSVVTVKDASLVRGLDQSSLLSGFVQLTNLEEEYAEAIQ